MNDISIHENALLVHLKETQKTKDVQITITDQSTNWHQLCIYQTLLVYM